MRSNAERYLTIEEAGAVVYDSRQDVPVDMTAWEETRRRFAARGEGFG